MFNTATSFNQDISNWSVLTGQFLKECFPNATDFNQNLFFWRMDNAVNVNSMFFNASSFNSNVGAWTTTNMADMTSMFEGATAFNQNISYWILIPTEGLPLLSSMFASSGMIGNTFGLSTPTPLKEEFGKEYPVEPLFNNTIRSVVELWIQDPNIPNFQTRQSIPYYNVIQNWGIVPNVSDFTDVFRDLPTFKMILLVMYPMFKKDAHVF